MLPIPVTHDELAKTSDALKSEVPAMSIGPVGDLIVLTDSGLKAVLESPILRRIEVECTLSARQREILHLISRGLRNREIAELLGVSVRTVKAEVSTLFRLLDATTRSELAGLAALEITTSGR